MFKDIFIQQKHILYCMQKHVSIFTQSRICWAALNNSGMISPAPTYRQELVVIDILLLDVVQIAIKEMMYHVKRGRL